MARKIGIIGAGGMANYHIPGFRAAGAEVVAVADVNREAAGRVAATFGIDDVYGSAARMLAKRRDVEAVSIITPNKFHKPLALQALAAGKHVFCEKPPRAQRGRGEGHARCRGAEAPRADVQLQQPGAARGLRHARLHPARSGRAHRLGPGPLDPAHRHPRLRWLVHHEARSRAAGP